MRILFINISDIKGGAAKSMWRIGEELSKGHEVKFLVRSKFSNDGRVTEVGGNRFINIFMNALGLQYKFLPVSREVIRLAKEFKPDVISLNQIEGGYFQTRDMIKLSKIAPIVWTMHDLWAFNNNSHTEDDSKRIYPQIGIKWGNWLKNQKKKITDKTKFLSVLPSGYLRDKYSESMIDRPFEIIPHGIDLDKFSPKKSKRMLFVAEKTSKGNLKPILEYLDRMLKEKVILTIIGEGKIEEKYKNIIIENRGYIGSEDELIFYYRDADVFIYPTRADVFGLVILEAISCGTPVITYNVGGVSEVIGEGGFLIKANSVPDFAFKIYAVLSNDSLRSELSERARTQALKFDIKKIAKQYEDCFSPVRI